MDHPLFPIPLRALIAEDSEDASLLPVKQLHRGGFVPECTRAETMRQCLEQETLDSVFADFTIGV